MTQCERIIKYINDFGGITQYDALLDLGIMRLASRIYDLKKDLYPIKDEWVVSKNRYGEKIEYKKYYLAK